MCVYVFYMQYFSSPPSRTSTKGFTLIELSIVLVIIGLITGGVLVGRDLIEAAKIRSVISDIEQIDTAVNTFRLKYNCIPGDCKNAARFGFRARSGFNCGDGNGVISSAYAADNNDLLNFLEIARIIACFSFSGGDESQLFWSDLSRASLIGQELGAANAHIANVEDVLFSVDIPNTYLIAANGDLSARATASFGYTLMGYQAGASQFTNTLSSQNFLPLNSSQAQQIDVKDDDGDPINGKVYTLDELPSFVTGSIPDKVALVNCSQDNGDGTGSYIVSPITPNACIIKFKGSL